MEWRRNPFAGRNGAHYAKYEGSEPDYEYVGIVRSDLRLKRAWDRLDIIYEETESLFKRSVASREICELRNMVNVGYLIMRQAMERKESRGLHYTIDYPHVKKWLWKHWFGPLFFSSA